MCVLEVRGVFLGAWVCVLEAESPVVCSVSRCPCLWVEIGVLMTLSAYEAAYWAMLRDCPPPGVLRVWLAALAAQWARDARLDAVRADPRQCW